MRYPCSDCPFTGSEPSSLTQHIRYLHQNTRLSCPICDTTHANKSNLKNHIMSKHENKKFICSNFPKKFSYESDLKKHIELHFKPNKCKLCSFIFGSVSTHRKHMKENH